MRFCSSPPGNITLSYLVFVHLSASVSSLDLQDFQSLVCWKVTQGVHVLQAVGYVPQLTKSRQTDMPAQANSRTDPDCKQQKRLHPFSTRIFVPFDSSKSKRPMSGPTLVLQLPPAPRNQDLKKSRALSTCCDMRRDTPGWLCCRMPKGLLLEVGMCDR